MKKAFESGHAVFATIAQGNLHIERRCYECETDNSNEYYVKINGSFYRVDELRRIGQKVNIWF